MSKTQEGADEFIKFINDTRSGMYGDLPFSIEECQDFRIDITLSENVKESVQNIFLYGLSH